MVTAAENSRQIAPDRQAQYASITLSAQAQNVRDVVPAIERALQPTPLRVTLTGAPVFYDDIFDVTYAYPDAKRCQLAIFAATRRCWIGRGARPRRRAVAAAG